MVTWASREAAGGLLGWEPLPEASLSNTNTLIKVPHRASQPVLHMITFQTQ